ncbi:MAG: hypothetical protein Ta2G_16980 [Termitinemataceae bacterium]|nr:MAG: hypothetical protein Ta2G_16980 [Termitinemataceae bacterium]
MKNIKIKVIVILAFSALVSWSCSDTTTTALPPPVEVSGVFATFAGNATDASPSSQSVSFRVAVIISPTFKEGIDDEADFLAQLTAFKGLTTPLTYYDYIQDKYNVGTKIESPETPWYTIDSSKNKYRYTFSKQVKVPTRNNQFLFTGWKITGLKSGLMTQYGPNPNYNIEDDDPNNDEAEIQIGETLYEMGGEFDVGKLDFERGEGIVLNNALLESKSAQITLSAQWQIKSGNTIEFNSQGADVEASPNYVSKILPGATAKLPKQPEKEGYTFDGWWTGVNGSGSSFDSNTPVSTSYTVYAKWSEGLKLTFNTTITQIPFKPGSSPYLGAGETQYSLDCINWTNLTSTTQTIPATNVVYLRGDFNKNITSGSNAVGLRFLFRQCTTLTKVEGDIRWIDTPIGGTFSTYVSAYRYFNMFSACTNLTTAPRLAATSVDVCAYFAMFDDCSSLTTAPVLSATTLSENCYANMFANCTSLTTAPALPVTTLAKNCYDYMFYGCTGLTTAPALPATTLAEYCYSNMFVGCTSLETAPLLPATTLAKHCYYYMFYNCTSLKAAPDLNATALLPSCYYEMFRNCSSLNSIRVKFTSWPATSVNSGWLTGTSATGTFYKPSALPEERGADKIPNGWTVVDG